jgi:hypothetical protein
MMHELRGRAADLNRARAALGHAAAILGANEAEMVAQHPEQRHISVDIHGPLLAVDNQSNSHRRISCTCGALNSTKTVPSPAVSACCRKVAE